MQEKIELLTDVQKSINQIENGQGMDHVEALKKVLSRAIK